MSSTLNLIVFFVQGMFSKEMSTMTCSSTATCEVFVSFFFFFFICPNLRVDDEFVIMTFELMME
jgi:hypothetical protein